MKGFIANKLRKIALSVCKIILQSMPANLFPQQFFLIIKSGKDRFIDPLSVIETMVCDHGEPHPQKVGPPFAK
ncbi:MAG: hypothetical protein KDE52_09305 [Calditrichaeota bacterium]|nr:hypothetical protein [Calditrichota bacterium]